MSAQRIAFRPVVPADSEMLYTWRRNSAVAQWWDVPASIDEAAAECDVTRPENADLHPYVILVDDAPIGYIQAYDGPDPATDGIDLFIGENSARHRGLGAPIIRAFVATHVFVDSCVIRCVVDPMPENAAAIAAYKKAGFNHVDGPASAAVVLMVLDRPADETS